MSKYKELVYMVIDELKLYSDDTVYTEDHIIFLLNKYRTMLLKQMYSDVKKQIPVSNYQTICLNLNEQLPKYACGNTYLKSIEEVPNLMKIGNTTVHPEDYYDSDIAFVSRDRMKYVGHNKYLQNIIYASLGSDNHLYLTSSNPQFKYIEKLQVTGIFEDPLKASELSCDYKESCDTFETDFPLEEGLVPQLLDAVIKSLLTTAYIMNDDKNDSNDEGPAYKISPSKNKKKKKDDDDEE